MLQSQPKDEKFTPKKYIDSVKKVFGGEIDLDPATSLIGNSRIGAKHIATLENDGLSQPWFGKVFCNPPYSRGNLHKWSFKMESEDSNIYRMKKMEEGILLTPNSTEAKWFQCLLANYPTCLTNHRIDFLTWNGKRFIYLKNPENGSAFFYFGLNVEEFSDEFSQYGIIVHRLEI